MSKHAFLSASGSPAWAMCEVKVWREKDLPEETSVFAEEGTLAHELLEGCLPGLAIIPQEKDYPAEMYGYIQQTLDYIKAQEFDEIYGEKRLDISFITGEEGAQGTADVIGIKGNTITVIDLKYGVGVQIYSEENKQLIMYGAAALSAFDIMGDIVTIKLVISQPRLHHISEWTITTDQLAAEIDKLSRKAKRILTAKGGDLSATPGNTQCKFCRVKADCPEYRQHNALTIANDGNLFDKSGYLEKIQNAEMQLAMSDDTRLANCMDSLELITNWCAAVKREVEKRLLNDSFTDTRWKLVQGNLGNRKITNIGDILNIAEEQGINANDLYEKELMSPAKLEKVHKKEHPVFWAKVQSLMTRAEGKPTVVPANDKRPALNLTLDFKPINDADDYIDAAIGLTMENKNGT